jgi:hypothetical protein
MKSDILLSLIKEVVKNEVKTQVKEQVTEQLVKLIKSGAVTLNSQSKKEIPSLKEMTEVNTTAPIRKQTVVPTQQTKREFTKDPMINEILNMTQPFSSAHRSEGSTPSVLDGLYPEMGVENEWQTMDFRGTDLHNGSIPTTGNSEVDVITKALNRDYTELVKRF